MNFCNMHKVEFRDVCPDCSMYWYNREDINIFEILRHLKEWNKKSLNTVEPFYRIRLYSDESGGVFHGDRPHPIFSFSSLGELQNKLARRIE